MARLELGVNIDHVATLRQARRAAFPNVAEAAREAILGGADQITMHLREDRRHIQDADLAAVRRRAKAPINMEMSLNPGIVKIALSFRPEKACIVPEKRQELTTEGGLDAIGSSGRLMEVVPALKRRGVQVSLFIAPDLRQIHAAARLGADAVELHTGAYAERKGAGRRQELARIRRAARCAHDLGLKVHAGHGLDYENTKPVGVLPEMLELNIGFAIVARSVFCGMRRAVAEMKQILRSCR